jgi:hypothetical protein
MLFKRDLPSEKMTWTTMRLLNIIGRQQDAFAPSHPAGFLGKLVHALHMRFEQRKNLKDIDEAAGITKELLEARPDTHRINVINLAHFIRLRFEQQPAEDPNDIEKIIVHQ